MTCVTFLLFGDPFNCIINIYIYVITTYVLEEKVVNINNYF